MEETVRVGGWELGVVVEDGEGGGGGGGSAQRVNALSLTERLQLCD